MELRLLRKDPDVWCKPPLARLVAGGHECTLALSRHAREVLALCDGRGSSPTACGVCIHSASGWWRAVPAFETVSWHRSAKIAWLPVQQQTMSAASSPARSSYGVVRAGALASSTSRAMPCQVLMPSAITKYSAASARHFGVSRHCSSSFRRQTLSSRYLGPSSGIDRGAGSRRQSRLLLCRLYERASSWYLPLSWSGPGV